MTLESKGIPAEFDTNVFFSPPRRALAVPRATLAAPVGFAHRLSPLRGEWVDWWCVSPGRRHPTGVGATTVFFEVGSA